MPVATVVQLEAELITLVKELPQFSQSGFSVFDLADMNAKTAAQTLPVVSVSYDGSESVQGNQVTGSGAPAAGGVVLINVQFIIVVALQYSYTGADDSKQAAFALLDQLRAKVLGYKNANTRPWRFVGERPEPEASGDGVVFYSQVWQTTLPSVGNSQ